MKNLTEQGYSRAAAAEREFAWDVTEKLCLMLVIPTRCSHRPVENDKVKTYESQTETQSSAALNVSVSQNVTPAKVPSEKQADSTTLLASVMKCDIGTRRVLYTNVALSLARPCFSGFVNP